MSSFSVSTHCFESCRSVAVFQETNVVLITVIRTFADDDYSVCDRTPESTCVRFTLCPFYKPESTCTYVRSTHLNLPVSVLPDQGHHDAVGPRFPHHFVETRFPVLVLGVNFDILTHQHINGLDRLGVREILAVVH